MRLRSMRKIAETDVKTAATFTVQEGDVRTTM